MPRAVLQCTVGASEALRVEEIGTPEPGPGDIVLRVRAAAINPFDAKVLSGRIPVPDLSLPRGVGSDVAGVVTDVGSGAAHLDGTPMMVGDEVLGFTGFGSLREELCLPAADVVRRPPALPWEVAGGLATAGLAALRAWEMLGLGPDDTVLVSAASGAVGLVLTQLAVACGAVVVGTASQAKHDYLCSLGALPVTYGDGLIERVRAVVEHPVTAVADNEGRATIEAGLALGVPAARIVTLVDHAAVDELGLGGVGRYQRTAADLARLVELVVTGVVSLPVARTFGLDEVAEAFTVLGESHEPGKLVVVP
jgi:NADPH:quinone reductase-like Zn-dependent oxidoreductase